MVITSKLGNLSTYDTAGRGIDLLPVEWHECNKRILHRQTLGGQQVSLRFLNNNPALAQGDVLAATDTTIIAVDIAPCRAIFVQPTSMYEAAAICYEIGNKHLPLFYHNDALLMPYDAPVFRLLAAQGYAVSETTCRLETPLKTTVQPHGHPGGESLFSKILKLTSPTNP